MTSTESNSSGGTSFSVVIPLFNKERHIRRAVESVLKQSCPNFELIVVNDGSTDRSVDALSDLLPSITLLHQDNMGESAARNTGITHAKNPYIAFLDADDEWLPDFLLTIEELIANMPACEVFCTNYVKKTGHETRMAILSHDDKAREIEYFSIARKGQTPASASSTCVKSSLFDRIGMFPTHVKLYPDLYFWTKAALHTRFAFHPSSQAIYHRDADNRVCNIIVPQPTDTAFGELITTAELERALSGDRLEHAKEFLCHYQLLNSFKAATQYHPVSARKILALAQPVTAPQKVKKFWVNLLTRLPPKMTNLAWRVLRKRQGSA